MPNCNSQENVAFEKPAWLSSTWNDKSKAENVVDGTKYSNEDTFFDNCVHTKYEPFPRWWVNLTEDCTIARIDINYRRNHARRMTGYKLIVSNTESTNQWNRGHQIADHICRDETRRNPPFQQTVSCLTRGRFITYADDQTTHGDPNPFVELCELEAFACGYGSFGVGCKHTCNCLNDTCYPENGTCPTGRCQRGWNGTACDQPCGDPTFGHNCEETCHCRLGSCDSVNGTCSSEGCDPGWQTESCSKVCDKGRFGNNCTFTCGACRNNGACDHVSGTCPNDCADGWIAPFCNEKCPAGTFGFNCTRKCFCKIGTCDPADGSCPNNECAKGWYGPSCSLQCEAGFFGYNCEESCHCKTVLCNRTSGLCPPGGCKDGWQTDKCNRKCDTGSYGTNCSGVCGNCGNSSTCHHVNGHCTQGCKAGFHGEFCNKECEDYSYGINCQYNCQGCNLGKCQRVHGACLRGCVSGMSGELCNIKLTEEDKSVDIIGAVVGVVILLAVIGLILILLIHRRKKKLLAKESKKLPEDEIVAYYSNVSENEQNLTEDKRLKFIHGNINTKNEKAEYAVVYGDELDEENIYKTIDDNISSRSIASHLSQYLDDDDISEDIDLTENIYTNYMASIESKIAVSGLSETIAFKKESNLFNDEYTKLPRGLQHPHECGKKPELKDKNRFKDMFPYDHSRVVLNTLPDVNNSDYINGNYIDSVSLERQYIATQGPKQGTVWDFWRMIWEQNTGKIIMVTNIKEGKKMKCHPYWPALGRTITNGDFSVTLTDEKRCLAFISRTLTLLNQKTKEKHEVFQFHFTTWPDHGIPNPFQLVQFQRLVIKQETSLPGPQVVHCSAGIGRTGTYIALDALLKHAQISPTIDVYQYTMKMRKDRLNMIQTVEQYIVLHEALDVSLTFPDASINRCQFQEKKDLRQQRIQENFKVLSKIKPTFDQKDYSSALSNANVSKNRSKECIPVNRFRVRLKSPLEGRGDYINAVVLPSCSNSFGFLATQLPLTDTLPDFWTMVYDYNSRIVVLLDRLDSDVQLLPEENHDDYNIDGFKLSTSGVKQSMIEAEALDIILQKQDQEKRHVKILINPVGTDQTGHVSTHGLVNAVTSTNRLETSQKGTAITVVCRDGKTNCVPFCLLKAVIERMDLDGCIDIFNAAREIQYRRPDAFKTLGDIRLIYQALEDYIHSTSIYSNE
ncbi:receptor-type tyrosine-protein phosphatase mu-like [Ylistrum balloti]|uniref:receptor-type tyrosine-protein phosphatase mu-like n=1 Tax=Ylistrum balloti TaxID=509963 RepID=UPI002905AFB0|nr:receptor-type tyrosine-protein phosphatase mu-like [Ylistrum balloti]